MPSLIQCHWCSVWNNPQGTTRTDGQGLPPENLGMVTNQGIDFELGFSDKKGPFSYFIRGNFTYAQNVINKIDEEGKKYDWQKIQGKQIDNTLGSQISACFRLTILTTMPTAHSGLKVDFRY